jgi:colanic acid biosynthesis glycosyl transferase WcaI
VYAFGNGAVQSSGVSDLAALFHVLEEGGCGRRKAALRILVYGLNYAPELTGVGKFTGEMASWLAGRGHEVHVVAAPPYYPAWKIRADYGIGLYCTERPAGGPVVHRIPLYVPSRPTGIKRLAHLISFVVGSIPVMLREIFWQPQLVFTVEPTFFGAPLAMLVARVCGAASWLHVQDFEVDAAFDLGYLRPDGVLRAVALWMERRFMGAFDRVSSISAKMRERSWAKGVLPGAAVLFPNWVDVETVRPLEWCEDCIRRIRRELLPKVAEIEHKIIFLYSGNMGEKQGIGVLAPLAAGFAGDDRIHFVFCGDGAFRSRLEESVRGMDNVTLLPLQPLTLLNRLLNVADVHLLPQRVGAADLVMPSRLTGMLASGRPVIAMADVGTQVALVVEGLGLVVPLEAAGTLRAAVELLVDNGELRLRLGRAARAYAVAHLGKEAVLKRFEMDMQSLVYGSQRAFADAVRNGEPCSVESDQ